MLKPGGKVLVTLPFIYNVHGCPDDYTRVSAGCLRARLGEHFEIAEIKRKGGIGSTLELLSLNWIDCILNLTHAEQLIKGSLFPIWVLLSVLINGLDACLDKADRPYAFYSNVLLLAVKR